MGLIPIKGISDGTISIITDEVKNGLDSVNAVTNNFV